MNPEGDALVDYRGITYKPNNLPFEDPDQISTYEFYGGVSDVPNKADTLTIFSYTAFGRVDGDAYQKGKSLIFFTNLPGLGSYELTFYVWEVYYKATGKRDFSYSFNGLRLTQGLDINKYRRRGQGLEIALLFDVVDCAPAMCISLTEYKLSLKIEDINRIPLGMNFGECFRDQDFYISAFAIIKFRTLPSGW